MPPPPPSPATGQSAFAPVLAAAAAKARASGRFASVESDAERVVCEAKESGAPATYRVLVDGGRVWVALVTPDRWLSQSIEQDLVHTGDKLESVVHDELIDQGYDGPPAQVEHFRSPQKDYVFRTALPIAPGEAGTAKSAALAGQFLLAYEACFAQLGDMSAGGEDEE